MILNLNFFDKKNNLEKRNFNLYKFSDNDKFNRNMILGNFINNNSNILDV